MTRKGDPDQRWLVGRVGGRVDWVTVKKEPELAVTVVDGPAIEAGDLPDDHLSHIGRLDDDHVIVSHGTPRPVHDGTYCVVYTIDRSNWSLQETTRLDEVGNLRAVVPLGVPGAGGARWLLVSHAADFWILERASDGGFQSVPVDPWGGLQGGVRHADEWRPGQVVDAARIGRHKPRSEHVIVSTDLGLYGLTYTDEGALQATPLHCLGPSGVHLALTAAVVSGVAYIWSADASGARYLMRTDSGEYRAADPWHRVQFTQSGPPAIQALARERPAAAEPDGPPRGSDGMVVWQTCRDESIVCSRYVSVSVADRDDEPRRLAQVTRLDQIPTFLNTLYAEDDDLRAQLAWITRRSRKSLTVEDVQQRVADLFDILPKYGSGLREFLSDPKPDLAIDALRAIARAGSERDAADAIHLWNHTLVGSLLRCGLPSSDELALGIVRWHQRVYRAVRPAGPGREGPFAERPQFEAGVLQAIKAASFDARRWTVFAPLGVDRDDDFYIPHVAEQVRHLGGVDGTPSHDARRSLASIEDRLGKHCILFKHRVDDEGRVELRDGVGGVIFDLQCETEGSDILVAGLWRRTSIRLFRIRHSGPAGATIGDEGEVSSVRGDGVSGRFGRALSFWLDRQSGDHFLLTSFREVAGEQLRLYSRLGGETESKWKRVTLVGDVNLGGATVLAMHRIEPGVVILGLRADSDDNKRNLRVIRVQDTQVTILTETTLPSAYATHDRAPSSPIGCISAVRGGNAQWDVLAGLDDGQIYRIPLRDEGQQRWTFGTRDLVDRLSTPIWRVAGRWVGSTRRRLRVFVGSGDGHLVAFESQPGCGTGEAGASATASVFARLWATREKGPIVSLTCCIVDLGRDTSSPGAGARTVTPVVLAVTRGGRGVIFDDHPEIQQPRPRSAESKRLERSRVPGQRLERFGLRSNAFAALYLKQPEGTTDGAASRLLVVTGDSTVRLLSVHLPKRSKARAQHYEHIWKLYFEERVQGTWSQLRYAEALRRVAPELWLIPIPSFFLPERQESLFGIPPEWFPLYQRAFRVVAEDYAGLQKWLEGGKFDPEQRPVDLISFERGLDRALAFGRRVGDRRFFKEMIEALLKRFNHTIITVAGASEEDLSRSESLFEVYSKLLGAIDRSCYAWLETDTDTYVRAQIVRAKNLVDGHVLSQLASALAKVSRNKHGDADAVHPFEELIQIRVKYVRHLLADGTPLVVLETLRAVNLSLLRAAWYMHRREESQPGTAEDVGEVDVGAQAWVSIGGFLQLLGVFASQAVHTADDALAHEIVRSYATCLFVAPHDATRVAISARSARLPEALLARMERQVEVVPTLIGEGTAEALKTYIETFKRSLRHPPRRVSQEAGPQEAASPGLRRLVEAERRWAAAFDPYRAVVDWLEHLATQLETSPGLVSFDRVSKLHGAVQSGTADRYFKEDAEFWSPQLEKLSELCGRHPPEVVPDRRTVPPAYVLPEVVPDRRTVPPAYVLISDALRNWCQDALDALAQTRVRQPEQDAYRHSLRRLMAVVSALPTSPAVQQQLVTGVLSHHLLEALDEHVLELTEHAHALYPIELARGGSAPDHKKSRSSEASAAASLEAFAKALDVQARRAQRIPKNLRTLYELIKPVDHGGGETSIAVLVDESFKAAGVEVEPGGMRQLQQSAPDVNAKSANRLRLVLNELASNCRVHGAGDQRPKLEWKDDVLELSANVPTGDDRRAEEIRERLAKLAQSGLQRPLQAARYSEDSTGLGLYLASLAAASDGWRLSLEYEKGDGDAVFKLGRVPR